jgi:RNA polymerase sigma-70 factor (ECF subfamily)
MTFRLFAITGGDRVKQTSSFTQNYNSLPAGIGEFIAWLHRLINFRERRSDEPIMDHFHRLLEAEIPRLRRYARALTRNAVRADDLVQDTLARALRKQHLWERGTDLRAWLFTIMHNQNINEMRRAMRYELAVDIDQCACAPIATTDPTGSRQLRELEHAIGQLPEEQRQVLLLVGLEGMSYEDTASILGIPVGTVRSRLSRGRDFLRKLMGMEKQATTVGRPKLEATARPPAMAA